MDSASSFFNLHPDEQEQEQGHNFTSFRFPQNRMLRENTRQSLEIEELDHERSLDLVEFNPNLPQMIRPKVTSILPDEPLLMLTMIRSNVSLDTITSTFAVTPRGMLYSLRNDTDGDITIGRQHMNENGARVNDIMLHPTDSCISRVHCRLLYKNGFSKRKVSTEFQAFQMMSHPRLGKFSPGRNLPLSIYRHIASFLEEKRDFIIEDFGSVYGTYLKLREAEEIKESCTILLGDEAMLTIFGVYPSIQNYLKRSNIDSSVLPQCQVVKSIFGVSELHIGESNPKFSSIHDFLQCPLMRFCVDNCHPCSNLLESEFHAIVIPDPNRAYEFYIGPDINSTVVFQKALSCIKIKYEKGRWFISEIERKSDLLILNRHFQENYGVWISINGIKNSQGRFNRGSKILKDGDEIKISETVLRVNWNHSIIIHKDTV